MGFNDRIGHCTQCLLVAVCVAASAACSAPAVGVRLVFPSQETFLVSALASIDIYDGGGSGDTSAAAICGALSVDSSKPPAGLPSLASTGKRNVCDLRGGAVALSDIGVGRRVIFAEAQSGNTALLRGCVVADLYGESEALSGADKDTAERLDVTALVDVPLATLPTYPNAPPTCDSIAQKCEEKKSCSD